MARMARSRRPVPGRNLLMAALWMMTGCSPDESVRPLPLPRAPSNALNESQPGEAAHLLQWGKLNDDSLWAHLTGAGGIAAVGLRQPGRSAGMERGRILVNAEQRAVGRAAIAAIPGVEILSADTLLPIVTVRLANREVLTSLRRLPHVEYVEPGIFTDSRGRRGLRWNDVEFGCSVSGYAGPANTYLFPGDLLPWNYRWMKIDSVWSKTNGAGVTIGLVDTGVDEHVSELNGNFASGMSAGRYFWKEATRPNIGSANPWHDTCGHGTRMASVIAGPRNGYGTLGVAWGANLYAVRVDDDVVLTEVEATRLGIRRAAIAAKIVAMAFGTYAYYSSIASELSYWYYNFDRLFFAAAGTTSCWDPFHYVTFPGTLETVTTVTAFDETGYLSCNAGRGYQVDFAAYTNQPAQGLYSLGTTLAGLHGSSGAVAVMSGLAGLYQAMNPGASRSSILSVLTFAASPTGGRSPLWGFGVPDAMCLAKELCHVWIHGPNLIQQSGLYTWTVYQGTSPGPIAYQWASGETTQTISRYVFVYSGMPDYSFTLGVTVRDTRNGRTRTDSRPVMVRDPKGCPTCF